MQQYVSADEMEPFVKMQGIWVALVRKKRHVTHQHQYRQQQVSRFWYNVIILIHPPYQEIN